MLALTLAQAKTIGAIPVGALATLAVVSAWIMKTVVQKAVLAGILGVLALAVWTQRASLQDCADDVRTQARTEASAIDTACSFFGREITISTVRDR